VAGFSSDLLRRPPFAVMWLFHSGSVSVLVGVDMFPLLALCLYVRPGWVRWLTAVPHCLAFKLASGGGSPIS